MSMKYLEMLAFSYTTSTHSYEQLKFIQTTRSPKTCLLLIVLERLVLLFPKKKKILHRRENFKIDMCTPNL